MLGQKRPAYKRRLLWLAVGWLTAFVCVNPSPSAAPYILVFPLGLCAVLGWDFSIYVLWWLIYGFLCLAIVFVHSVVWLRVLSLILITLWVLNVAGCHMIFESMP